ncbi:hypothetical protein [Idiomarina abyssalis]|uniref:hypothetical protein n=1 Tax=Idiomarina abyssalis TaxID=86102 RepID=UPI003A900F8A
MSDDKKNEIKQGVKGVDEDVYRAFERSLKGKSLSSSDTQKATRVAQNILKKWDLESSVLALEFEKACSSIDDKREVGFTKELVYKVSLILGIYADLKRLFLQDLHRLEWLKKPNENFDKVSPKELLGEGSIRHLEKVSLYLKSWTH